MGYQPDSAVKLFPDVQLDTVYDEVERMNALQPIGRFVTLLESRRSDPRLVELIGQEFQAFAKQLDISALMLHELTQTSRHRAYAISRSSNSVFTLFSNESFHLSLVQYAEAPKPATISPFDRDLWIRLLRGKCDVVSYRVDERQLKRVSATRHGPGSSLHLSAFSEVYSVSFDRVSIALCLASAPRSGKLSYFDAGTLQHIRDANIEAPSLRSALPAKAALSVLALEALGFPLDASTEASLRSVLVHDSEPR